MRRKPETDVVIAQLMRIAHDRNMSSREQFLMRESLRSLVRLAQSELMLEMHNNVRKLSGASDLRRKRPRRSAVPGQQNFEFNSSN